jgi:hypothetical protein
LAVLGRSSGVTGACLQSVEAALEFVYRAWLALEKLSEKRF